ncbi:hypothetical protein ACFOWZ_26105 [Lentzea rhizosphaerae]|uniref:Extracellular repeat, HAF family n=1 Tax=Lentzea rhizosphaerae TaxID=2041025 RepID=A0ABV8BYX1_9PSEU
MATALLATVVGAAPARAELTLLDLGGLPSSTSNWVGSINDSDIAVGASYTDRRHDRAVKYDGKGGSSELVGPAGASTTVKAVNNRGAAAGTTSGADVGTRAIRFNPDGTYQLLITPSGYHSSLGLAIDGSGTVYGIAMRENNQQIPVRWRPNGVLTAMKLPQGATWAYVTSASANGYVAGYVSGPGIAGLAVRWNPDGTVTTLGRVTNGATSAQAVNNRGEVVGNANGSNNEGTYGARWTADGSVIMLAGDVYPKSVNDSGVIVGFKYLDGKSRPYRWTYNGDELDLGLPEGATEGVALDVNSDGVIVGIAGSAAVKWTTF